MATKRKPKADKDTVLSRRLLTTQVRALNGPPAAQAVYLEVHLDGSEHVKYGEMIHATMTSGMLNGSQAQKSRAQAAHRPELFRVMQACAVLLAELETACLQLDRSRHLGPVSLVETSDRQRRMRDARAAKRKKKGKK